MRKLTLVIYAVAFSLSAIVSFFATNNLVAILTVIFLLFISSLFLMRDIWNISGGWRMRSAGREKGEHERQTGDFAGVSLYLKGALEGSDSSRREVATILREALLDKYAESKDYPVHWIYTDGGRDAIAGILGINSDLIDVLEPPSKPLTPARRKFRRKQQQDFEYKWKLQRVLSLVETRKS
ncbi:MAG: hypothetical protein ACREBS_01320 [Nitrososphaerales archaeon]